MSDPPPQPATTDSGAGDVPALPEGFLAGASAASRRACLRFAAELLCFGPGVEDLGPALAAEPEEPRLQLLMALLNLYGLDPGCQLLAGQLLDGLQGGGGLDAFGRGLLEALIPWQAGAHGLALQRLEALSAAHPEALLLLKLIEWLCFCRGQELHGPRLLDRALQLEGPFPLHPDRLAIHSFALELCGRLGEARDLAEAAIAQRSANAWADHTLAHWALRSGRFQEGLEQQQHRSPTWAATSVGLRVHNLWHLALLHMALGDQAAAAGVLDGLIPSAPEGETTAPTGELIDVIALGWRLELAGAPQDGLWERLMPHLPPPRLDEPLLPFLAVHYAWALARADQQAGLQHLLTACDRAAAAPDPEAHWSWARGGAAIVRGVAAAGAGQWSAAASLLLPRQDRLGCGGGSDAQVQVLHQTVAAIERHACLLQ